MMVLVWPEFGLPKNRKFFLPMAVGRMAFSTRLLSIVSAGLKVV